MEYGYKKMPTFEGCVIIRVFKNENVFCDANDVLIKPASYNQNKYSE
jgi:hypothetical protein